MAQTIQSGRVDPRLKMARGSHHFNRIHGMQMLLFDWKDDYLRYIPPQRHPARRPFPGRLHSDTYNRSIPARDYARANRLHRNLIKKKPLLKKTIISSIYRKLAGGQPNLLEKRTMKTDALLGGPLNRAKHAKGRSMRYPMVVASKVLYYASDIFGFVRYLKVVKWINRAEKVIERIVAPFRTYKRLTQATRLKRRALGKIAQSIQRAFPKPKFEIRREKFIKKLNEYVDVTGKDIAGEINHRLYWTAIKAGAEDKYKSRRSYSLAPSQRAIASKGLQYWLEQVPFGDEKGGSPRMVPRITRKFATKFAGKKRKKKDVPVNDIEAERKAKALVRSVRKRRIYYYKTALRDIAYIMKYKPGVRLSEKGESHAGSYSYQGWGSAEPTSPTAKNPRGSITVHGGKRWNWADRSIKNALSLALAGETKDMLEHIKRKQRQNWNKARA